MTQYLRLNNSKMGEMFLQTNTVSLVYNSLPSNVSCNTCDDKVHCETQLHKLNIFQVFKETVNQVSHETWIQINKS